MMKSACCLASGFFCSRRLSKFSLRQQYCNLLADFYLPLIIYQYITGNIWNLKKLVDDLTVGLISRMALSLPEPVRHNFFICLHPHKSDLWKISCGAQAQ